MKELGIKHESAFTENANFKKLLVGGSTKLILSQGYIGNYENKGLGEEGKEIERSQSLSDLPLWVATSKKTSDEAISRVRAAIEAFKKSPKYKKIIDSY